MPDFPEIVVLRHGQTVWNREGRHQGQLDSRLTDLGQEQAIKQGQILTRLLGDARWPAFCSPQGRASATARIALSDLKITPQHDDNLKEIHFGQWQGLTVEEIAQTWPDLVPPVVHNFDMHFLSPDGETFGDLSRRARTFLAKLTEPSIIVTHGMTSRLLRGHWLGLERDAMKEIGGGQGVVFHLVDGQQTRLEN